MNKVFYYNDKLMIISANFLIKNNYYSYFFFLHRLKKPEMSSKTCSGKFFTGILAVLLIAFLAQCAAGKYNK